MEGTDESQIFKPGVRASELTTKIVPLTKERIQAVLDKQEEILQRKASIADPSFRNQQIDL